MTAPPLHARLTAWERLRERLSVDPANVRLLAWIVPTMITVLAAVLRLWDLGQPREIMFDETYYVKDAWSLWTFGHETTWGEGADADLVRGDDSALKTDPSFVVHPPLGKWIIALGMALMGPGSSFGWRLTTAVLGALTVLLVYLITLRLARSITVAAVAAGLLAIDGLGIVMSRIALLDGILTFFILLGFLFALLDREHMATLMARRLDASTPTSGIRLIGPVLWARPWLIAAGVTLGAASAVKWSGLYALAVVGLYAVATDALARRRADVVLWPTDATFRQGPASFVLLVGPALAAYLISWTGWLVTEGGWGRDADANPFVALWIYHSKMLGFHVDLSAAHPYASPAWQWPLLLRPTAIWVSDDPAPCGTDHCIAVISSLPNPLIWWGGFAAVGYLAYRIVRAVMAREEIPAGFSFPLVGLAATYLPWLLFPERTIFQFYTIVMAPFLVIALAVALRELAGRSTEPLHRRQAGQRTVAVCLVMIVLVSAFFLPVWMGMSVPYEFWLVHNWLPGWI